MEITISFGARRWLALLAVLGGAALVVWALFGRKNDEELIRERLERLTEVVRVEMPDENPLFRGKRVKDAFDEIFTANVRVEISELTQVTSGREELVRVATRAGSTYSAAQVTLEKAKVELDTNKTGAKVDATFVLAAERGAHAERDRRRVQFDFAKHDGEWRITSVVVAPKEEP